MKIGKLLAGLVLVGGMAVSSEAFAQSSVAPRLKSALSTKLFAKFCGSQLLKAAAKFDKKQDDASLEILLTKMPDCEERFLIPAIDTLAEIREELDPGDGDDGEGDDGTGDDGGGDAAAVSRFRAPPVSEDVKVRG